jgi:hypothetical protein
MENMHVMLLKNILIILDKLKVKKLLNNIGEEFGLGILYDLIISIRNILF